MNYYVKYCKVMNVVVTENCQLVNKESTLMVKVMTVMTVTSNMAHGQR
jgi:hypothetical protein